VRFERSFTVDLDEATAKQYILAYMRKLDYTYVPNESPVLVFTRGTVKQSVWHSYPTKWESVANIILDNQSSSVHVKALFDANTILEIGLYKNKLLRMWHRANWAVWEAELDDLVQSITGDEYTTDRAKRTTRKAFRTNNLFQLVQTVILFGIWYVLARSIITLVYELFETLEWGPTIYIVVGLLLMCMFWIFNKRTERILGGRSKVMRGGGNS
jgi:hypothetical protein